MELVNCTARMVQGSSIALALRGCFGCNEHLANAYNAASDGIDAHSTVAAGNAVDRARV